MAVEVAALFILTLEKLELDMKGKISNIEASLFTRSQIIIQKMEKKFYRLISKNHHLKD